MEALKLLIFVGTEGIYHDHAGNGQFLTSMLNGTDTIEADFSQDYDVLADGLEGYDTVLFYTDVGELTVAQENGLLNYIQQAVGSSGYIPQPLRSGNPKATTACSTDSSTDTAHIWTSPLMSVIRIIRLPKG